MDHKKLKSLLIAKCKEELKSKAEMLHSELKSILEAANEETKNSAGDKFETGREMLMAESEKIASQLKSTEDQLVALRNLDTSRTHSRVNAGALVKTDKATYFISTAMGKVEIENHSVFVISAGSPIGQALHGKTAGESCEFQNQQLTILELN